MMLKAIQALRPIPDAVKRPLIQFIAHHARTGGEERT
jgi:hypothetical protein